MNDFVFSLPTKIFFGRGQLSSLSGAMAQLGRKVLIVRGHSSVIRSGVLDKVKKELSDFQCVEISGVDPNPKVSTVREGIRICREEKVEVILAVGGGSVIDCAKAIAAGIYYDGDVWDLVLNPQLITKALPICTILTIAATGSEADAAAVISNAETHEKLTLINPLLTPKVSILDPEFTFSVSSRQTAAGSADILSHLMEVYFGKEKTYLTDRVIEALMKTVIKFAPVAMKQPCNYEARANLMLASSLALDGLTSIGKAHDWSCHYIEHELSAFYDITHGVGLAIVTPQWMRYILNERTIDKFADFAVNLWGVDNSLNKYDQAIKGIESLEAFFKELGLPTKLSDLGIGDEKFAEMARHAVQSTQISTAAFVNLTPKAIENILKMCV